MLLEAVLKIESEALKNQSKISRLLNESEAINKMIELKIPIKKQIDLILENQVVEKLFYAEYYNFLKKHFFKNEPKKTETKREENRPQTFEPSKKRLDPKTVLSQDFDLSSSYVEALGKKI